MSPPGKKHDSAPTPDLVDRFHRSRVLDTPQHLTPTDHGQPGKRQDSTPNKVTPRGSTGIQAIIDGAVNHKHIPHGKDSYLDHEGNSGRHHESLGAGNTSLKDAAGSMKGNFNTGAYEGARAAKVSKAGVSSAKHLNPKSRNG